MPRHIPTWAKSDTLKNILRLRIPPHPSFDRLKHFFRRKERSPVRTPPDTITPGGDDDVDQRSLPPSSTPAIRRVRRRPPPIDILHRESDSRSHIHGLTPPGPTASSGIDVGIFHDSSESPPLYTEEATFFPLTSTSQAVSPSSNPRSPTAFIPSYLRPPSTFRLNSPVTELLPGQVANDLPQVPYYAPPPFTPTSQAGPWVSPFLSDLRPPSTFRPNSPVTDLLPGLIDLPRVPDSTPPPFTSTSQAGPWVSPFSSNLRPPSTIRFNSPVTDSPPSQIVNDHPQVRYSTSPPGASTFPVGPRVSPFLSDLRHPSTFNLNGAFTGSPPGQMVDGLPQVIRSTLTCPGAPRTRHIPLLDCELTNEQDEREILPVSRQSWSSSVDGPHLPASEAQECPPERAHESYDISFAQMTINDYFRPRKLVIDWEISLTDIRFVLSALQQSLEDLTISLAGINQFTRLSTTEKIDLSYLTFLKVDGVAHSFLKELLSYVKMDNLSTFKLRINPQEVMPHELDIECRRLENVSLQGKASPQAFRKLSLSGFLRDVAQLEWSGKLVEASWGNCSFRLESSKSVTIDSDEDGCTFFLHNLKSNSLRTLRLSHFPPALHGPRTHGLAGLEELSVSDDIDMNQFLDILCLFPSLKIANFGISDTAVAETNWSRPSEPFAQLEMLSLRCISAPIRPLLAPIPLSKLQSLHIKFSAAERGSCLGLAECLREGPSPLRHLHLVDANISRDELRSSLEAVGPTLVNYHIEQASFS